jgi:hypothetical protein
VNALAATFNPAQRGFHAVYRDGEVNRCPGCGRTHWFVGRVMAECGFCSTALPLEASLQRQPAATITKRGECADPWPVPSLETPRVVKGGRGS